MFKWYKDWKEERIQNACDKAYERGYLWACKVFFLRNWEIELIRRKACNHIFNKIPQEKAFDRGVVDACFKFEDIH